MNEPFTVKRKSEADLHTDVDVQRNLAQAAEHNGHRAAHISNTEYHAISSQVPGKRTPQSFSQSAAQRTDKLPHIEGCQPVHDSPLPNNHDRVLPHTSNPQPVRYSPSTDTSYDIVPQHTSDPYPVGHSPSAGTSRDTVLQHASDPYPVGHSPSADANRDTVLQHASDPHPVGHAPSTGANRDTVLQHTSDPYPVGHSPSAGTSRDTVLQHTSNPYPVGHAPSADANRDTVPQHTSNPYSVGYSPSTDTNHDSTLNHTDEHFPSFRTSNDIYRNLAAEASVGTTPAPERSVIFRSSSFVTQREARSHSSGSLHKNLHHTSRFIDNELQRNDGDLESVSASQYARGAFTATRKGVLFAASGTRHTVHAAQFGTKLAQDIKTSGMSAKAAFRTSARYAFGSFSPSEGILKYRYTPGGVVRIVKNGSANILRTASDQIADTHISGSDFASSTPEHIKNAGYTTVRTAKLTVHAGSAVVQFLRHPILSLQVAAKGLLGVFCGGAFVLFILLMIVLLISGAILSPATTLVAEDQSLSDAWLAVTQLDAEFTASIRNQRNEISADEYHFFLNGNECDENITIETDAALMLAYLNTKYQDYDLATVLPEIHNLHNALYALSTETKTIQIQPPSAEKRPVGPLPSPSPQPTPVPTPVPHTICNIYVTTQPLNSYFTAHAELMTQEQWDMFSTLQEVGITTLRQELGSPFPGVDWTASISSRWGWRWHPIHQELRQHKGLDIAMAEGTPIQNVLSGVAEVGFSSDYGNYVIVTSSADPSISVLYAHMQSSNVVSGQTVGLTDTIGYVGNTGISTGPHLHIEYQKGSQLLNPYFYLMT